MNGINRHHQAFDPKICNAWRRLAEAIIDPNFELDLPSATKTEQNLSQFSADFNQH